MPATYQLATVLACLAALSSGFQGDETEALVGKEFCAEGACPISIGSTLSDTSTTNPELLQAGPADRDAQARRTRRVGFSHEDVSGDESLRPFLSTFRESLAKGDEDAVDPVHMHSRRSSIADTLIQADDDDLEVTKTCGQPC